MDKELKEKWVAALRSGKFKQGKGFLKDDGKYCCLGVLREIIKPRSQEADDDWAALSSRMATLAGLPPYRVADDNVQRVLAKMNDEGEPFDKIADYIEANL